MWNPFNPNQQDPYNGMTGGRSYDEWWNVWSA